MDDRAQEAQLVVAIAAGDADAFEALYDRSPGRCTPSGCAGWVPA